MEEKNQRCRCNGDNIKTGTTERGCKVEEWIHLAKKTFSWPSSCYCPILHKLPQEEYHICYKTCHHTKFQDFARGDACGIPLHEFSLSPSCYYVQQEMHRYEDRPGGLQWRDSHTKLLEEQTAGSRVEWRDVTESTATS